MLLARARIGACVRPWLTIDLHAELPHRRVVLLQFRHRVDVIVLVVVLTVGVEERLRGFGPVFHAILACVGALPQALLHGRVVGRLEPAIERWIDRRQTHLMDRVRELMDEDALGGVGITGVREQVLLAGTHGGPMRRGTEPTRTHVPVALGLEVAVLGHVGGDLAHIHDRHAHGVGTHRPRDLGAAAQHAPREPDGFLQRTRIDLAAGHERQPFPHDALFVERLEPEALAHIRRDRTRRRDHAIDQRAAGD